jgi:arsenate reductase
MPSRDFSSAVNSITTSRVQGGDEAFHSCPPDLSAPCISFAPPRAVIINAAAPSSGGAERRIVLGAPGNSAGHYADGTPAFNLKLSGSDPLGYIAYREPRPRRDFGRWAVIIDQETSVLFLCSGNSCRSIMAEAILRHLSGKKFRAHSAGSRPAGFIHPLAVHALTVLRVPLGELTSKNWNEFGQTQIDVVITLCDSAAKESCPFFPGTRFNAHWSLPDPAFHVGNEAERASFAVSVAQRIRAKIEGFVAIDWESPTEEIAARLRFLGEI